MKTCTKCGETKPFEAFHRDAQKASGYRPDCKPCTLTANRTRHAANRDLYNERQRDRWWENRDRCLARSKTWRDTNRERKRDYDLTYAAANRDKRNTISTKWANKQIQELGDWYVKMALKQLGLSPGMMSQDLIEAKREHLRLVRLLKEKCK